MKRLLGVLTAATLWLALMPGGAVAEPADLPRGADPKVAWSDGSVIHTPEGQVIELPDTTGQLKLLGKSAKGWVVHEFTRDDVARVWRNTLMFIGPDGTVKPFFVETSPYYVDEVYEDDNILVHDQWDFRLNDKGTLVIRSTAGDEAFTMSVISLGGKVLLRKQHQATPLDFRGNSLVFTDDSGVKLWQRGHKPRRIARRAAAVADLRHNVVFVRVSPESAKRKVFGPTRISRPGKPRWTARFTPVSISPDGTRVAGYGSGSMQIRRVSDGKVIRSFSDGGASRFEGNDSVLAVERDDDLGWVIVRCSVGKACVRASEGYDVDSPAGCSAWHIGRSPCRVLSIARVGETFG